MNPALFYALVLIFSGMLVACQPTSPDASATADPVDINAEAQAFIDDYTEQFMAAATLRSEAEWAANTVIIIGVDTIGRINDFAAERYSALTGDIKVIENTRNFLKHKDVLTPLQIKQLQAILYEAANNPQTEAELVKKRNATETIQNNTLFGFAFEIDGEEVTPNQIDRILTESGQLPERLNAWEASKAVGKPLKPGLVTLVELRNKTVQALGYDNFFEYQVSDYGMTRDEMMAMMDRLIVELKPLYRELHTWARYELAQRYQAEEVPDLIPAHWLPNRWGQDWSSLIQVEGINLDEVLKSKSAEWVVKQAERFYISLGFDPLPETFYERSSLYPLSPDAGYKKNTHASAWHMDLENDVRSLMSVEPNASWYETTHHELGHIYYYMCYTRPEVPPLLRGGANRAFHEAIGSMLGLASMQKPFLEGLGLVEKNTETDDIQALLKEALNSVVFIPFSAGTMSHFEHDLYAAPLSEDQYNQRWWDYVKTYQGIAPPAPRPDDSCDGCTKTHINNDPAQYYDYALSHIILHQMHGHIAEKILKQDPRATNYYGNKAVGQFLNTLLSKGAVQDWREVMRETLGEEISAKPMLDYFQPLMAYLKKENEGRKYTL